MEIYNKEPREVITIIEKDKITLDKDYDVSYNGYVMTDGQKMYADIPKRKKE